MRKILKILFIIPLLYLVVIPIFLVRSSNSKQCGAVVVDIKDSSDYHFVTKRQLMNLAYGNSGRILGKPVKDVSVSDIESRVNVLRELKKAEAYMTIDGTVHISVDQRIPVMRVMPDDGGDYFIDDEGVVIRKRNLYNPRLHIVGGNINISSAMLDGKSVLDTNIKNSILEGLSGTVFSDRILGHQCHLTLEAERKNRIINNPINTIIAYVTALMEVKSSMGIIVAAPTAGSSGLLGGAILGVAEGFTDDIELITKSFLAAGLIGVFIADKYTFAAEEGGCQVECGAGSGMAAAGLVQLMGGTARQAIDAASMALQNILGLVCDPVADRVEVPCLGKNILGATNALCSANMSIAGFDPVIPLDEVIDAMKSVGDSLPSSLCCTGCGGLSVTPTALKLHEKLKINSSKVKN